jgi:transposase InsO family protein
MQEKEKKPDPDAWARLRFAIIGPLLSSPQKHGDLVRELKRLSERTWSSPVSGEPLSFAFSTIERWYYLALSDSKDPVGALRREVRSDFGISYINPDLVNALRLQHKAHRRWSYQLHFDNLDALVKKKPELGPMTSYATLRRFMTANGMVKEKRRRKQDNTVDVKWVDREVRSFEAAYVGSLWHFDFHHCSLKVLARDGQWQTPIALGIIDDHSRLACHVQWYLSERAEDLVHGLSQAFQKWGLPRGAYSDNGPAMKAEETCRGFLKLGIHYSNTAPYSPHQNAKQESFWRPLEGRLISMLEKVRDLSLEFLNEATQAWCDLEYNRKVHSETTEKPLDRYLRGPDVLRPCPPSEDIRMAFRLDTKRTQRRSDGTVTIEGVRFEIPARFRHIRKLTVRYARWNLDLVHVVDERTGDILCRIYPLDKEANASGRRRLLEEDAPQTGETDDTQEEIPPLLQQLLDQYSESGKPPGYIPKPFRKDPEEATDNDNDNNDNDNQKEQSE